MGQYFRAVNLTKREYVDPWDIGGGAKLWEWCANSYAGIFPYLLRQSSEGGGGDLDIAEGSEASFAGRWAGDGVYLVGDYDESQLFDYANKHFTNISFDLVRDYNQFIGLDELKLKARNNEN
jgi:hypothetical protein